MLDLETTLARILAAVPTPVIEPVPLNAAAGRYVGAAISAHVHLPPFDNSAMDGYAVRAEDVVTAGTDRPVRLRLAGRVEAGQRCGRRVEAGECVRLFTGSPLPPGADAVVMQEDTKLEPDHPGSVLVMEPTKAWENVRFKGEDLAKGDLVLEPGELLTAPRLGLLAALGHTEVQVARRPRVGVVATGSELREAGEPLEQGQIYESNRLAIGSLIDRAGGLARLYPIVADRMDATRAALEGAFEECDAIITCGGVSVGEMDFVKQAFEELGGKLQFWKVAIKPGRPFVFGILGSKLLFGLPGNPVSALVTCLLLVAPALRRWQGVVNPEPRRVPGTLAVPIVNSGNRRHFVRVTIDADGEVRSAGPQASHRMKATARSEGLIDVPADTTQATGTRVSVLLWD